jgi:outer membrane protein
MSVSAVASYQFAGLLSRPDDRYFDGMHDPRGTVEAGVELKTPLPGGLRGQVVAKTDILGVFDGQEVGMSLSRRLTFGEWSVSPGVGGTVLSRNMADYYFGVRREEARADRPAYSPGAAVLWGPRLTIQWRVSERVGLISLCRVEFLGSEITGSPLIEEEIVVSTMTGLSFQF